MRLLSSASTLITLFMLAAPVRADDVDDLILKATRGQTKTERMAAIEAIAKIKDPTAAKKAFPIVEMLVEDKDFEIRETAILPTYLLAHRLRQPFSLALVKALFDPDEGVRQQVLNYLGPIRLDDKYPPEAIPLLLQALEHPDENVRNGAMFPLVHIGGEIKKVVDALEKCTGDKQFNVRNSAEICIFKLKKDWERYIRHVLLMIESREPYDEAELSKKSPAEQRELTTKSLISIGASQRIHDLGNDEPDRIAPLLAKFLNDKSPAIRRCAARCLGAITLDNPKAKAVVQKLDGEKELKKLLDDPDESVRTEATTALKRIAEGKP